MKPLYPALSFLLVIYNIAPAQDCLNINKIPNGNYIYTAQKTSCQVCHEYAAPTTAQSTLNAFGTDFKNCGKVWGSCLGSKDSDHDSFTNETELACLNYGWVAYSGPCGSNLDRVTNPGDPLVTPTISTEKNAKPLSSAPYLSAMPNPFNPRTTLRFSLAEGASAELTIISPQGKIVKTGTLSPETVRAGHVDWDGMAGGREACAGVYLARLVSAGKTLTARLILTR